MQFNYIVVYYTFESNGGAVKYPVVDDEMTLIRATTPFLQDDINNLSLKSLGLDGWELVSSTPWNTVRGNCPASYLIFKKPISPSPDAK